MEKLAQNIVECLEKQGFVIVSTIDERGSIHSVAKGIVGIERKGIIYLIDLFKGTTFENLKKNHIISITAVDEHHFIGYTLKGTAKIVEREKIKNHIMRKWEERVIQRISQRVIKSVKGEKKSDVHPEAQFPRPQYLIMMEIDGIIDLAPSYLKISRK